MQSAPAPPQAAPVSVAMNPEHGSATLPPAAGGTPVAVPVQTAPPAIPSPLPPQPQSMVPQHMQQQQTPAVMASYAPPPPPNSKELPIDVPYVIVLTLSLLYLDNSMQNAPVQQPLPLAPPAQQQPSPPLQQQQQPPQQALPMNPGQGEGVGGVASSAPVPMQTESPPASTTNT